MPPEPLYTRDEDDIPAFVEIAIILSITILVASIVGLIYWSFT